MKKILVLALAGCAAAGNALAADPPAVDALAPARIDHSFEAVQQLSEADLKEFYLGCARAAMQKQLASGEIAVCSTGYERLLQGTFGGDFRAFLAWRRSAGRSAEPVVPKAAR